MSANAYSEHDLGVVHRLMRDRRDIRNGYVPDPIPDEVLTRILAAAHAAPSVGLTKPWDFIVLRGRETRQRIRELVLRERDNYARTLSPGRAEVFRGIKIEAIMDTPVNVVVTCDESRGGRRALGRRTQPMGRAFSVCMAIENLWLAARAEGVAVNQVGFLDNDEVARLLALPPHLSVIGYLCLGYVTEFPSRSELVQSGWARVRPLDWVVHEEEYGHRGLPGQPRKDLLSDVLTALADQPAPAVPATGTDAAAVESVRAMPQPAAVAVFVADHGHHLAAGGATARELVMTAAAPDRLADACAAEVVAIDVGAAPHPDLRPDLVDRAVRPGTRDWAHGPALGRTEVMRAVEAGIEAAFDLITAGNRSLAATAVAPGGDLASARLTGEPGDPLERLEAFGGLEHAALTGFVLAAAASQVQVLLDGHAARAAGAIAGTVASGSVHWFRYAAGPLVTTDWPAQPG